MTLRNSSLIGQGEGGGGDGGGGGERGGDGGGGGGRGGGKRNGGTFAEIGGGSTVLIDWLLISFFNKKRLSIGLWTFIRLAPIHSTKTTISCMDTNATKTNVNPMGCILKLAILGIKVVYYSIVWNTFPKSTIWKNQDPIPPSWIYLKLHDLSSYWRRIQSTMSEIQHIRVQQFAMYL